MSIDHIYKYISLYIYKSTYIYYTFIYSLHIYVSVCTNYFLLFYTTSYYFMLLYTTSSYYFVLLYPILYYFIHLHTYFNALSSSLCLDCTLSTACLCNDANLSFRSFALASALTLCSETDIVVFVLISRWLLLLVGAFI